MAQILRDPCHAMHRWKGPVFAASFIASYLNGHDRTILRGALTNVTARRESVVR
jgi:hypothetical protein